MKKLDVLLIDDDPAAAGEERSWLCGQPGVDRADCAASVPEALAYCAELSYDVAVVDSVLPGGDGFSFLEKTATLSHPPGVLVLSAVSSEELIRRSLELGAKYYMIKPCRKESLYQRILDVAGAGGSPAHLLDRRITDLFLTIGVPPHLKGAQYLKEAVRLTAENRMIVYRITRELYPRVAEAFGVTPAKVELSIRHAAQIMYDRDRMKRLCGVIGFSPAALPQKPTNGELIALLADKLISELPIE